MKLLITRAIQAITTEKFPGRNKTLPMKHLCVKGLKIIKFVLSTRTRMKPVVFKTGILHFTYLFDEKDFLF